MYMRVLCYNLYLIYHVALSLLAALSWLSVYYKGKTDFSNLVYQQYFR